MVSLDAERFNMRQWALDHERRDDERFRFVNGILAFIAVTFVALAGWSLKTQYDAMAQQVQATQVQLAAIQRVSAEVKAVSKEP